MNRKEIELRIWGLSIASARNKGIISGEEAKFLLDEYVNEFKREHSHERKRALNFFPATGSSLSSALPACRPPS